MTTHSDPTCLTGNPPAPCSKCDPSAELAKTEEWARGVQADPSLIAYTPPSMILGGVAILAAELDRLREALRAACERARAAEAEVQRVLQPGDATKTSWTCAKDAAEAVDVFQCESEAEARVMAKAVGEENVYEVTLTARRVWSEPKPATGAEFLEAAATAIEPRSDEEIKAIIADMGKR